MEEHISEPQPQPPDTYYKNIYDKFTAKMEAKFQTLSHSNKAELYSAKVQDSQRHAQLRKDLVFGPVIDDLKANGENLTEYLQAYCMYGLAE